MNPERLTFIASVLIMAVLAVRCGTEDDATNASQLNQTSPAVVCQQELSLPGSHARFAIDGATLYAISGGKQEPGNVRADFDGAQIFDVTDPADPKPLGAVSFGVDIQSMFAQDGRLFVGSCKGLDLYGSADGAAPQFASTINDEFGSFPTAVRGTSVFISRPARGSENQITIYDISDLSAPKPFATHAVEASGRLALDGDKLFLCEGDTNIKVFDAADPSGFPVLDQRQTNGCTSVLAGGGTVVVTNFYGITQLSSATLPLAVLSTLNFVQ